MGLVFVLKHSGDGFGATSKWVRQSAKGGREHAGKLIAYERQGGD